MEYTQDKIEMIKLKANLIGAYSLFVFTIIFTFIISLMIV